MKIPSEMVLTEITQVLNVYSVKGAHIRMTDRTAYGLSLCRGGRIVYRHGGRDFVSDDSCAVLLPRGATYDIYRQETGIFPLVNFQADGFPIEEFTVLPLKTPDACFRAYDALFRAFGAEKNRLRAMRSLYELFDLVFSESEEGDALLLAAETYLREHLGDPALRNADLARVANISEVYFRRLFTKRHGVSPHRYLLMTRIEDAKRRLAGTSDSVGDIALACGFSDIFHFCRSFHTEVGCTPRQYRERVCVI